jgi:hypothetical protein
MTDKKRTNLNLSQEARENLKVCAEVYAEGNWSRMVTEWAKRGVARLKTKKEA